MCLSCYVVMPIIFLLFSDTLLGIGNTLALANVWPDYTVKQSLMVVGILVGETAVGYRPLAILCAALSRLARASAGGWVGKLLPSK